MSSLARCLGIIFFLAHAPRAALVAQSENTIPSRDYTHAQRLVAIDGNRRLNLFCLGTGSPTVLLDAGAGEQMMVWRHVQRQIASVTHTCSYDRAGYGYSDPSNRPSDARNAVDDLHRLLRAAVRGPIVYVGHSIAGLYGTLLVATYPHDVAGVVFVDPAVAHQYERTTATFTPGEVDQMSSGFVHSLDAIQACTDLARSGTLTQPTTKDARGCVDTKGYADSLDDVLRRELERQYAQPKLWSAARSEYGSLWPQTGQLTSVDDAELDGVAANFGDRPFVVLTHGEARPIPGISPSHMRESDATLRDRQAALAKSATRGVNVVVAGAGHHIQFDRPNAVIDAVRRVVADVRRDEASGR